MSKTRSLHHIVFATKQREMTITESAKKELYAYILGMLRQRRCYLIRMNGIPNHIHMLVDVNPTISIANLVQEIKQGSSKWLKGNENFPKFRGWGEGYYAVSVGVGDIASVKQYIMNQEAHHDVNQFIDEIKLMAEANNLDWHEKDLD